MVEVLIIQNKPAYKKKQVSIEIINEIIETLKRPQVDLIILPEMALIGYKFKDRADILD